MKRCHSWIFTQVVNTLRNFFKNVTEAKASAMFVPEICEPCHMGPYKTNERTVSTIFKKKKHRKPFIASLVFTISHLDPMFSHVFNTFVPKPFSSLASCEDNGAASMFFGVGPF